MIKRQRLAASVAVGLVALAGCGQSDAITFQDTPALAETREPAAGPMDSGSADVDGAEPAGDVPQVVGFNLKVRPGLWEGEANTAGDIVRSQSCVGDQGIPLNEATGRASCRPNIVTRPGGVTLTSDCDQSGVNIKSKADFRTSQTRTDGDITITVTPAGREPTTMTSTMTSRWVAASCPAGMAPGDMRLIDDEDDE